MDFEKLGLFYLGRRYDLETRTVLDEPVLYDSRDLVTHAVCIGMTGSGKTGLSLALLEEAIIDGIPVIAIDPKGDIGNLLLTFPRLAPEDFRPWIDEGDAVRAGMSPDAYAAAQADAWRKGLAEWGQDGARIERLRRAAEFTIYTPGSRAGTPVSILSSFAAPPAAIRDDAEALGDRAAGTATSVLSLAGVDAPPRSREHTLLAALFTAAWRSGMNLDLASLIQQIQTPPFSKIGVVDVDSFFPSRERFDLAMRLNGLLAAPGFERWLEGAPLDPASLLYRADGHPRVAVFSIAHLDDAERMFFVSLLLNQVVAWMRTLSGTSSLRAIVYMDEIAGYFPPVANPPAKPPLMTLLKQGRAFGVGVVLSSQNPVDLDYKALANTGTWFLGTMQTDRDKQRVLDGLEGGAAKGLDRAEAERLLSSLTKRVFLLHNVHETGPVVFHSRWAMSYLRGPLTRDQIRTLSAATSQAQPPSAPSTAPSRPLATSAGGPVATRPPVVPPGIQQFFVPILPGRTARQTTGDSRQTTGDSRLTTDDSRLTTGDSRLTTDDWRLTTVYTPVLLGAARVTFADAKAGVDATEDVLVAAAFADGAVPVDWAGAVDVDVAPSALLSAPEGQASFAPLPRAAVDPRNYPKWEKSFARWVAQARRLELLRHAATKLTSRPGESERDFRVRVQEAMRAARDAAVDAVRRKFATRRDSLSGKLQRADAAVARESEQASQQKVQTAVSFGATVLGALLGRKAVSAGSLGRATTAARGVGRSMKEAGDVKRAEENRATLQRQLEALDAEIAAETEKIAAEYTAEAVFERVSIVPTRGQVAVQFVALGWIPASA